jgi:predicted metal-dependent enzyme (double-stranded beta helix superfamily)
MVPPPGDSATGTWLLHADPGGAFSIQAIYWRPGQTTRIHDHVAWCVFGVVQGVEHEERFRLSADGAHLIAAGSSRNVVGDVSGFAPPGDIHRVRNSGSSEAISIHVYGTGLSRLGSSARRFYDLPVVPPAGPPLSSPGPARASENSLGMME